VRGLVSNISTQFKLTFGFEIFDHFAASINDKEAHDIAVDAMKALNINYGSIGVPMRASEDFGIFGMHSKAAMLCLGPGKNYAALHNPDYDFNDDLIPIGTSIYEHIIKNLLGVKS